MFMQLVNYEYSYVASELQNANIQYHTFTGTGVYNIATIVCVVGSEMFSKMSATSYLVKVKISHFFQIR